MRPIVTPRILLRWHAEIVKRRCSYPRRRPGRPYVAQTIRALALKIARDSDRMFSGKISPARVKDRG